MSSVKAVVFSPEQHIIHDSPVGGQIFDHQYSIEVEIDTEVLVAYALPGILTKDDIGAVWISAKDKALTLVS